MGPFELILNFEKHFFIVFAYATKWDDKPAKLFLFLHFLNYLVCIDHTSVFVCFCVVADRKLNFG
jgi:hypothetical protein